MACGSKMLWMKFCRVILHMKAAEQYFTTGVTVDEI